MRRFLIMLILTVCLLQTNCEGRQSVEIFTGIRANANTGHRSPAWLAGVEFRVPVARKIEIAVRGHYVTSSKTFEADRGHQLGGSIFARRLFEHAWFAGAGVLVAVERQPSYVKTSAAPAIQVGRLHGQQGETFGQVSFADSSPNHLIRASAVHRHTLGDRFVLQVDGGFVSFWQPGVGRLAGASAGATIGWRF